MKNQNNLSDLQEATFALSDLETTMKEITQGTQKHLNALQTRFQSLKKSIYEAVTPFGAEGGRALERGTASISALSQKAALAAKNFLVGAQAGEKLDGQIKNVTKTARALVGAANKSGRSLASFDELIRLQNATASGKTPAKKTDADALVPQIRQVCATLEQLAATVNSADFGQLQQNMQAAQAELSQTADLFSRKGDQMADDLTASLGQMGAAIRDVGQQLSGLQEAWNAGYGVVSRQVPNLAQGTVVPANRTFQLLGAESAPGAETLADTFREGITAAMEDYTNGNMAGHEATVALLQQILEAVLGITIGDDVLEAAVVRQQAKMAVVKGGAW